MRTIVSGFLGFALTLMPLPAMAQLSPVAKTEIESLTKAAGYKAAVKKLDAAQAAGDESFETNEMLIEALFNSLDQVGLFKKASITKSLKKALERSVELQPENIEALGALAQFHMEAPGIVGGDDDEARVLIERIRAISPAKAYTMEAEFARSESDVPAAMEYIDKALALEPENTRIWLAKGFAQIDGEDYANAITTFETCLSFDPSNQPCLYQIGKASQVGKIQPSKGIAAFNAVIAADTEGGTALAYAHYRLGSLYEQSDDKISAATHYDVAIELGDIGDAKNARKKLD